MDPYLRETIETWVSDFGDAPSFLELPAPAREYASEVLPAFLVRACEARQVDPDVLEEDDVRSGLLEGVGALTLPASVRAVVPELCGAFLAALEAQGRLADGASLGRYVHALRGAYEQRTGAAPAQLTRPGSKLGRNDPCPCGSGRKYKKCCQRREL